MERVVRISGRLHDKMNIRGVVHERLKIEALFIDGGSGLIGQELVLELGGLAIRIGDALETLKDGIEGDVDLVLLDGAFSLYLPVLKLLEPYLRDGAFVIGENAFEQTPGYLEYVRNPQNGYLSLALPFQAGRGNELTIVTR